MTQRSDAGPASGGDGTQTHAHQGEEREKGGVVGLIIGSMGVVYGDIGTSPLYALRESLAHSVKADVLTEEAVIGPISLLIFALIFTVTIKYVVFLMRADNRGEGGILSLMALAQSALGGGRRRSFCSASRVLRYFPATPSSRLRFRSCRQSRAWSSSLTASANSFYRSPFSSWSRCSGCRAMERRESRHFSARS